jgi:hypothetical protein
MACWRVIVNRLQRKMAASRINAAAKWRQAYTAAPRGASRGAARINSA